MSDDEQLTFGERLILAEERQQRHPAPAPAVESEVVTIQREDFTTGDAFRVQEPGRTMPVTGPGTLIDLVINADSDQYDVYLTVDDQVVVDDSFTGIQQYSTYLERIATRDKNTNFVFTASDYEFQHSVNCAITPQESMTFRLQRAEIDLVRGD